MSILGVQFGNFSVANAEDYAKVLKIIDQELNARLPDQDSPGGYQPDQTFQKMTHKFSDAFSSASLDLRKRVADGGTISNDEMKALERAEIIQARASATGLSQADARCESLQNGQNPYFTGGRSTSRMLRDSVSLEDVGGRGLGVITFRL